MIEYKDWLTVHDYKHQSHQLNILVSQYPTLTGGYNFRIILFIFCYKINIMEHLRGWWSQSVDNYCVKRTFPVVWCSSASFIRKIPQIIFFPGNLIQLKMNCILTLNLFHPLLLPSLHKYLFKILLYPLERTLLTNVS